MWSERIETVRGFADAITERDVEATTYRGYAGITRYFEDVAATWDEWRVEVETLAAAPDGRVVIVMSTHMCGKGGGVPLVERVAHVWEFKDEKLWRATLYRDPAEALATATT